jgi:hypothetical protein
MRKRRKNMRMRKKSCHCHHPMLFAKGDPTTIRGTLFQRHCGSEGSLYYDYS